MGRGDESRSFRSRKKMEKKSNGQRTFSSSQFLWASEKREGKKTLVCYSAVIRIYNMIHLLTNRNRKILNVANPGAQRAFQPIVLSAPRIPLFFLFSAPYKLCLKNPTYVFYLNNAIMTHR